MERLETVNILSYLFSSTKKKKKNDTETEKKKKMEHTPSFDRLHSDTCATTPQQLSDCTRVKSLKLIAFFRIIKILLYSHG